MATNVSPSAQLRVVARDPKRTRERILAAALKEFSAKGLAGARVDQIARRARINKRMLYHYFGNKNDLFKAIMRRKLEQRVTWATAAPDDPGETLTHWFSLACEDMDWVRLMEWEALAVGDGPILSEAERKRAFDQVQMIFAENLPVIYFVAPRLYMGVSTRVGGLSPSILRPQLLWNIDQMTVKGTR